MNPSTALARVLIDELGRNGVREAVLAPGSRSAPFAFALHAADAAGAIRLHVRIDERSAGFLALGLAKASGRAVPVVTTSGTATANLYPAVLEASFAGVPLLVLTADRPSESRAVGANQTADQIKMYGDTVRLFHEVGVAEGRVGQVAYWRSLAARAIGAALGTRDGRPGPVHLNVAFREPLMPDGSQEWVEPLETRAGAWTLIKHETAAVPHRLEAGPRTVVLAGDGAGAEASRVAETAGWPLLAEPSSGARRGPNALGPYRLLLEHESLAAQIQRVVVFGRPTLSRSVTRLLSRADIEVVVVSPAGDWPDVGRTASLVVPAIDPPHGAGETDPWLGQWLAADAVARVAIDKVLGSEPVGPVIAREVAAAVPANGLLFVGASNPVRDLDLAATPYNDAQCPVVLANRGLSGIDGTVSTAVGAALAHHGPAVAFMGDLTFLHDANGLILGPDEPRPDLCIVVVNDDGGGIFGLLEQGAPEHAAAFERVFGTPHCVDVAALCAATRTPHQLVTAVDQLRDSVSLGKGVRVVEVRTNRHVQRDLHQRLREAVATALRP